VWFLEEMHTEGVNSTLVHSCAAGIRIQKIYFPNLCWIKEPGVVVEHGMCAKLRGATLAALDAMREGLNSTQSSATKYDYIIHVLAEH
jgi:hypothetical protein